jgi:hypothetical protein
MDKTDRYWICTNCGEKVVRAWIVGNTTMLGACNACQADQKLTVGGAEFTHGETFLAGQRALAERYAQEDA